MPLENMLSANIDQLFICNNNLIRLRFVADTHATKFNNNDKAKIKWAYWNLEASIFSLA